MDFLDVKIFMLLLYCRTLKTGNVYGILSDILGLKIETWTDLVYFSLLVLGVQGSLINVYKANENSIRFLETSFHVLGKTFTTDGLYKVIIPFQNDLELIEAVLNAIATVFNINGYRIDPFKKLDFSKIIQAQSPEKRPLLNPQWGHLVSYSKK